MPPGAQNIKVGCSKKIWCWNHFQQTSGDELSRGQNPHGNRGTWLFSLTKERELLGVLNKILFHLVTVYSGLSSPAAASYKKQFLHEGKTNSSGEPCHECYGGSLWQALIVFYLQSVTLCSTVLACLEHQDFIQCLGNIFIKEDSCTFCFSGSLSEKMDGSYCFNASSQRFDNVQRWRSKLGKCTLAAWEWRKWATGTIQRDLWWTLHHPRKTLKTTHFV